MIEIVIGILVVIAAVYLGVVFYQHYLLKKANEIEKQADEIAALPLPEKFKKVKELGLTGDSLASVKSAYGDYQHVTEVVLAKTKRYVNTVKKQSRGVNFVKTHDSYNRAENQLQIAEEDIKVIQQFLDKMIKLSENHRRAVTNLENRYKKVRTTLLTENASFGPAIDALEIKLSSIEKTFDDFSSLTNQGDHERAEQMLGDLTKATEELEHDVETVPGLYKTNHDEFGNQIAEITESHDKMTEMGILFPDDHITGEIAELVKAVDDNYQNLADLDLKLTKDADVTIENKINKLYDELEFEIVAKQKVDKKINVTGEFIEHARKQNQALIDELDRLSHNYSLEHGEIDSTNELGKQIDRISERHAADLNAMANKQAIYSEILIHIEDDDKQLNRIENKQKEINDSVADFSAEEQVAHQVLNDLDLELHSLQRKIDDLNLPGISQDYIDYFGLVSDEINHLNRTMNQVKISMDDVKKQMTDIKKDRDTLEEKTDDLLDSAMLAEQVMQYANRYSNSSQEVGTALKRAQHQFDDDYDYEGSLETIAAAVDKVNPGSYKRIENAYYKNKAANVKGN